VSEANNRQIDFYFDYISHNAYLAWHVLPAMATKYVYTVRPVPVLFAGFLQEFGQLGPAEIKPKIQWMNRNNLRKAALLGIPLNPPKLHPFNPLFILRLTAQDMPEHQRLQITDRIFSAIWVEGVDPNDREAIGKRLDDLDKVALIAGSAKDAAKAQVRANTDEAIARGCFGVPSMVVNNEVFWGYDDLSTLEAVLAGFDPLDKVDHVKYHSGWEAASAAGQHRR
tara:strand:+ start:337 stop:1011 length:675 start_codon:yes stop_codon:yes gene_type:complete